MLKGFDALAFALGLIAALAIMALLMILAEIRTAHAHDWRRPDLDQWYGSLKRPGVASNAWGLSSCCSKTDCHTTQAELRGGEWWARIGVKRADGDWDLKEFVRVPPEVVLQRQDNPAGEGVICHSITWAMDRNVIDAAASTIYCFVPPSES
jgi:hypothetical protein